MKKTLGEIAWEAASEVYQAMSGRTTIQWHEKHEHNRAAWEAAALAVVREVSGLGVDYTVRDKRRVSAEGGERKPLKRIISA